MAIDAMDAKVKPSCGEQLQSAREAQSLKLSDVALQLKLPEARLIEIESSEYDPAISATFYRGYIRAYARLLKLDVEPLLESFNQTVVQETAIETNPRLSAFSSKKEVTTGTQLFKWMSAIIVISILSLVAWGLKERFSQLPDESALLDGEIANNSDDEAFTNTLDLSLTVNEPVANEDASAGVEQSEHTDSIENESLANENRANESNESASESVNRENTSTAVMSEAQPVPGDADKTDSRVTDADLDELVFAFVGDCWVEVTDATGERLAIGIKRNGKVMTLQGKPPFKVLLGDPSVVSLQHNQNMIDLSGYRAGRSVNLVID